MLLSLTVFSFILVIMTSNSKILRGQLVTNEVGNFSPQVFNIRTK